MRIIRVLAGAVASVVALAASVPGLAQTEGGPAAVSVHRGAEVRTVTNGVESAAPAPAVRVSRGKGYADAARAGEVTAPRAAPSVLARQSVAGDTVWLVDRKDDRLIACELVETADFNATKIRCRGRSLPD